ncbi:hypothetical protein [Chelativorans alearense]|uniref:hypothetical protein n=1 Tax=Chelativorans alearense TaxID=2681495 RepID=UPI0013D6A160|nr:hypothetical protein [Chelativorans alearense]
MTTSAANNGSAMAGWLAYATSPTFALMGLIAASDATGNALCSVVPSILPIDGMTAMYLLMSLFHLPPWLRLFSTTGRAPNR